jgi:hypothetical protein
MAKPKYTPAQIELMRLKEQDGRAKYPSVPDYARPKPKLSASDANSLTKAIVSFIDLSGGWATRISVEGRYIESLGKRIPSSVKKGTADIHAVYKGRHLSIEVKIGKDRQSEEQKDVQKSVEAAGGHYFIARNFDDFHQWITSLQ